MPSESDVVVVSCGLITPVGLSGPEVAASARSRVQRLGEIEWRDRRFRRFVVGLVPEEGLPDPDPSSALLPSRVARMLRLAEPPLLEALTPLPERTGPVPLLLGLPELQTTIPIDTTDFLTRLAARVPIDAAKSAVFTRGRASGLLALKSAIERLAKGKVPFILVGGLDCQVDLYILGTLDLQGRIRNEINPDGFAPSEGAGFLLLTTVEVARRHSLDPLARVVGCSSEQEKGHIYSEEPYKGDGLATAFASAFKAAGDLSPIGCVYASFNGERYWAKEFGVAMLRQRSRFDENHQMEHPAECFGDLGTAHGAVMLGLACLGIKHGYRRSPALVYSSSDYGDRAVALLTGA